jgi:hypothetical protein
MAFKSTNGKIISPTTPSRLSPTRSTNSRRCPTRGAYDRCRLTASQTSSCVSFLAMTFDRKRCRATCSSKYSQAQPGLFPGSTHPAPGTANCWPRGGGMHVRGERAIPAAASSAPAPGQDGPHHRADPNAFPPGQFDMVDCTDIRDYEFNFMTSHQYYRMSPQVRSIMAVGMAGPVVA